MVEATPADARRRPRWAVPLIVVAVVALLVAAVVGISGLTRDPVVSVGPDGRTTLTGRFEPVECPGGCRQGYLQAGARSVFVRFPDGCSLPMREQEVTVVAVAAPDLGRRSYRTPTCP